MSPYIVRLAPVRERKRQPEQVPGNGALDGDYSIPMTLSGRHLRTKLRTIFPGCQHDSNLFERRLQAVGADYAIVGLDGINQ
jgi:hypothetical protein